MGSRSHSSKRKKKRSQKRSKKRSRSIREKSKKRYRRDDSVSCSSGEDSATTSSFSGSSSEDDYRRTRKRGRSRDRKGRMGRKKRTKMSSSVSENSGDSPVAKKSKRMKRNVRDSDLRKKRHGKKRRREPGISSSSGRSMSSSPCEPSDESEREFKRREGKSEAMERKRREKSMERSSSLSRYRSRSCSPSRFHSEEHDHRVLEEKYPNPKRLKSVIIVINQREEDEDMNEREEAQDLGSNKESQKDEIVFDDDYPSRSNDSNDGVSRRETLLPADDASNVKPGSLGYPFKEAVASEVKVADFSEIQCLGDERNDRLTTSSEGSASGDRLMGNKTSDVLSANSSANAEDLEAILRQKALENLLKKRGNLPMKVPAGRKTDDVGELKMSPSKSEEDMHNYGGEGSMKPVGKFGKYVQSKLTTNDSKVKKLSTLKNDQVQAKPDEEGSSKNMQKFPRNDEPMTYLEHEQVPNNPHREGSIRTVQRVWRNEHVKLTTSNALMALRSSDGMLEDKDNAGNLVTGRHKLGLSMSARRLLGSNNTWRRELTSQETSKQISSMPDENAVIDSAKGVASTSAVTTKLFSKEVGHAAASEPLASGEKSTKGDAKEADDDSEFQQKTMTVMRGGELVQVNYKVRFPKKTPALARRQLKR